MDKFKKWVLAVPLALCSLLVPKLAFAAAGDPITYTDMTSVVTAMTAQLSTANVLTVIVGGVTLSIGFVFLWWGIRYVFRRTKRAAQGRGMNP